MTNAADDAWPELVALVAAAPTARILEGGSEGDREVLGLTKRSCLGAVIGNSGGITVDQGWLRLLGGTGSGLPSLVQANTKSSGLVVVGFDVLGGVFALDGGALGAGDGSAQYFAPDTLEWEGLGTSYSELVAAMLAGSIEQFYEPFRWAGWQDEVGGLGLDRGMSFYPPLSTAEGKDPSVSSRRAVQMRELVGDLWPLATGRLGQPGDSAGVSRQPLLKSESERRVRGWPTCQQRPTSG
ncbi:MULTISPECIES: DUF2625 family protein [unclassified Curtobacterium]|uniref:DUF2625 family protein n=1 Tax=unclassified Curtobacterium TaxID=257496 RepID=UPI00226B6115|nr:MULTISPECIES: DUF2625 family protein [unclassified Curtobacterium]